MTYIIDVDKVNQTENAYPSPLVNKNTGLPLEPMRCVGTGSDAGSVVQTRLSRDTGDRGYGYTEHSPARSGKELLSLRF